VGTWNESQLSYPGRSHGHAAKVCCPKCGSTDFSTNKREVNKTLISAFASGGGLGLVTRYTEFTCLKCGEKFKTGK